MNYVIAASRKGYEDLPRRLAERTGHAFHFIGDPSQLNADVLKEIQPRYVFFPHWSHRIREAVFGRFECVIFHMTDLPFGRGGSPLQNLIARGIYDTQLTALRCVAELDAGPVYAKRPLSLEGSAQAIYGRAAGIIEELIVWIVENEPVPSEQTGVPVCFSRRRPEESDLSSLSSLEQVYDHIRMLDADGYPHAFLETEHLRLEFTGAAMSAEGVCANVHITRKAR